MPPDSSLDPRQRMAHRQPGLDFLRAAAIALVLLYHAGIFGFTLPWRIDRYGWIGVDLFFVLSGYLIGGQLLAAIARRGRMTWGTYYARRAFRILPAYLAVLALYLLLPLTREYAAMPPAWKFLTFTQNFGLRGGTTFSHAWSLCIEAQFYLLLPWALLALRGRGRLACLVPAALILAGILLRVLLAAHIARTVPGSFAAWQNLIYYPTYARLDSLIVGVALAALQQKQPAAWVSLTRHWPWLWLPGLAAIVWSNVLGLDNFSLAACGLQFPLLAFGFGTFLLCALHPRSPLARSSIPGAAFLATIAYSVYLSHKIILHAVEQFCAARGIVTSAPLPYCTMLFGTLAAGSLLFFAVERPFLVLRRRWRPPLVPGAPASTARPRRD